MSSLLWVLLLVLGKTLRILGESGDCDGDGIGDELSKKWILEI